MADADKTPQEEEGAGKPLPDEMRVKRKHTMSEAALEARRKGGRRLGSSLEISAFKRWSQVGL